MMPIEFPLIEAAQVNWSDEYPDYSERMAEIAQWTWTYFAMMDDTIELS